MKQYISLINIEQDSPQAIYVQVANGLIKLIRSGILKSGTKLPSIRELARELMLHPKTIVAAYEEMALQDWIYSKPRSGMIVVENLPELKPQTFYSAANKTVDSVSKSGKEMKQPKFKYIINDGFPDYRLAPIEQLLKQYKNSFYDGHTELFSSLSPAAGSINLRTALAKYLSETRALNVNAENLLITRGAQMAIYLTAALLLKNGDTVIVGEPSYTFANRIFEQAGAKLIGIPVDKDGIDTDAIEKYCQKKAPKLIYIIPHHHHPTTVTLSTARRMKLLSLIQKYNFYLIEDDYDYEFHYTHKPILPLASAEQNGHVIYIGSITKNLSPSIRVGYMIASQDIIDKAAEHKKLIDIKGDALSENALATLYGNGTMQRHINKSLKLYKERRDKLCDLLQEELGSKIFFKIPDGGMAVWVEFNKKYSLPKIAALAATKGLWMSDGLFYNSGNTNYNALRIGFASLNEKEMKAIIGIIRSVIDR